MRGRSVEYLRTVLAKGGWDGLEGHNHIFADEPRGPAALKAFFAESGVGVTTYHLPYGFENDLADFDEGGRKAAVDRVLACVETPPFAYGPDYSQEAWRLHSANVRQLAAAALA